MISSNALNNDRIKKPLMYISLKKYFALLLATNFMLGCCMFGYETRYESGWQYVNPPTDMFHNNHAVDKKVINKVMVDCRKEAYQSHIHAITQQCVGNHPSASSDQKDIAMLCGEPLQQLKNMDVNVLANSDQYLAEFESIVPRKAFYTERDACIYKAGYVFKSVPKGTSCRAMKFF